MRAGGSARRKRWRGSAPRRSQNARGGCSARWRRASSRSESAAEAGGLPFPLVDDGTDVRAPIAGLVAGLRAAAGDLIVALPVDCPLLEPDDLRALAAACADAAVPQTGPLPGAYRKSALPVLERRLASGRLAIRDALAELDAPVVHLDPARLANANTPEELALLLASVLD